MERGEAEIRKRKRECLALLIKRTTGQLFLMNVSQLILSPLLLPSSFPSFLPSSFLPSSFLLPSFDPSFLPFPLPHPQFFFFFNFYLQIFFLLRSVSVPKGLDLCPLREADSGLFPLAASAMAKFCTHHRVAVRTVNAMLNLMTLIFNCTSYFRNRS